MPGLQLTVGQKTGSIKDMPAFHVLLPDSPSFLPLRASFTIWIVWQVLLPLGLGKVAPGETAHAAIVRELREEIGIEAGDAERLMYYAAVYPGRTIWLDVWMIRDWSGQPRGLDAQSLEWVEPSRLREHDILEADAPIVAALARR